MLLMNAGFTNWRALIQVQRQQYNLAFWNKRTSHYDKAIQRYTTFFEIRKFYLDRQEYKKFQKWIERINALWSKFTTDTVCIICFLKRDKIFLNLTHNLLKKIIKMKLIINKFKYLYLTKNENLFFKLFSFISMHK